MSPSTAITSFGKIISIPSSFERASFASFSWVIAPFAIFSVVIDEFGISTPPMYWAIIGLLDISLAHFS